MGNGDQPPRGSGQPPGDDEQTVWIPPNRAASPPGAGQSPWHPPAAPPPGMGAGAPPPPPYPPNQWQPPRGNAGQWKWIALAAVGVLVIVGSVVVIARSGGEKAPAAAPPGPSVSAAPSAAAGSSQPATSTTPSTSEAPPESTGADGLTRYLLTQAEVQDALKEPVAAVADGTEPIAQTTDRADCGGALLMPTTYGLDGSGHTALATQLLQDPNDQGRIRVLQWVIGFPDGPAAAAYVANEYQRWGRCRLKTVSLTEDDRTSQWTVGVPQTTRTQLTNLAHQRGAGDWWCQQTGVARSNVVVGAQVCQTGSSTKAMGLAGAMARKVAE